MSIEFRYSDNRQGKTDPWIRFKNHARMADWYIDVTRHRHSPIYRVVMFPKIGDGIERSCGHLYM
jgi:hypothetical protein